MILTRVPILRLSHGLAFEFGVELLLELLLGVDVDIGQEFAIGPTETVVVAIAALGSVSSALASQVNMIAAMAPLLLLTQQCFVLISQELVPRFAHALLVKPQTATLPLMQGVIGSMNDSSPVVMVQTLSPRVMLGAEVLGVKHDSLVQSERGISVARVVKVLPRALDSTKMRRDESMVGRRLVQEDSEKFCVVIAKCDLVYHNWRTNPESYVQSQRDTSNDRRCFVLL